MNTTHHITAKELMDRLQADPTYTRTLAEAEQARQAAIASYRRDEATVIGALRGAGANVETIEDLIGRKTDADVAAILLSHLTKVPHIDEVRMSILGVLGVKANSFMCRDIMAAFVRDFETASPNLRFAFVDAIATFLSKDTVDAVVPIVQNPKYGDLRRFLIPALGRVRSPAMREILEGLCDDPGLKPEAMKALDKCDKHMANANAKKKGQDIDGAIESSGERFVECSIGIDLEDLQKVLEGVSNCAADGFGRPEIERIMDLVDSVDVRNRVECSYEIMVGTRHTRMIVSVVKSDADAVEVYVLAPQEVADCIDAEMLRLLE